MNLRWAIIGFLCAFPAVQAQLVQTAPQRPAVEKIQVSGTVLDRQGQPVAGARVLRQDARQRVEVESDADGKFRFQTAMFPPGFLFVEKDGFRFHGQRCDRAEPLTVTLVRRTEPSTGKMTTLPSLPRAERKEVAMKLLEPYLARIMDKDDDTRLRPLEMLAKVDPGRALEELEKRPFKSDWHDSYVRRFAFQSLLAESADEARTLIASMRDPAFRCFGYLDLCDALPAAQRDGKLALLQQALLHSQSVEKNDHRVLYMAAVARRLWALGEKERATQLLREGHAIAKELPTAAWAGFARGAFAEDLALVDLPAALELMKDLQDPFENIRHHGNLAHKLAGTNPAEAERLFDMLKSKNQQGRIDHTWLAGRLIYRMAGVDLPRARKLAESLSGNTETQARAYGAMAQALAKTKPQEALALLDQAFDILAKQNASNRTAMVAGIMLPVAEQIDPALVPEFFWRALSLCSARVEEPYGDVNSVDMVAMVLARYDRDLTLSLVEQSARRGLTSDYGRNRLFQAAALASPRRAAELVEQLPEGQAKDNVRQAVVNVLLYEGAAGWRSVHRTLGQWHVDDEDI